MKRVIFHLRSEVQLAHKIGSKVAQAYNRAKYLEQRRELLEWWGEWLDERETS
ncbi:MAG: hypothetical protein HF962_01650 [Sulfurovum sp.]|nr:hypothetical protein [Sulfurovum sp.]